MSVKRLDGWAPASVTEYEYDDDGRLVRAVTEQEPEWDETERGWMVALTAYRMSVHDQCGTYLPDSTGPAAEGAYRAKLPIRCHACTARMDAVATHLKGPHANHPEALLWQVERRGA